MEKETLAQVFSCEFCKISKNTSFTEHLRATASASTKMKLIDDTDTNFNICYLI